MITGSPDMRAAVAKWCRERLVELPLPIVDLGGKNHRGEMADWLGRSDFETWDSRPGRDVSCVVDAQHMKDVPDGSVGTYICISTLEHVARPWLAAAEMLRTLRKGGRFYVVAPFIYEHHEAPADYWRFTPDGLRVLFGQGETGWINCPSGRAAAWIVGTK